MNSNLKTRLSHLGFPSQTLEEYKDGVELAKLTTRQLPNTVPDLMSKIKTSNLHQTANKIININLVLKAIRECEQCPEDIRKLTAFAVLQNENNLVTLLGWLANVKPIHSVSAEEDVDLANLYFVSSVKKEQQNGQQPFEYPDTNHPIYHEDSGIKNMESVKIMRPRTKSAFSEDLQIKKDMMVQPKPYQTEQVPRQSLPVLAKNPPKPYANPPTPYTFQLTKPVEKLSESHKINRPKLQSASSPSNQADSSKHYSDGHQQQESGRIKSVAPNYQSWKSLRSNIPQNPSNTSLKKSAKFNEIEREINQIERSIRKQQKSIKSVKTPANTKSLSRSKQKPVVFVEVDTLKRKQIVQWLISISVLNSLALKNFDNLHLICRDGLVFPEVINNRKGRGPELKYERNPKKTAQTHANYKRVFDYLKQFPSFNSQLIYRYEYFVPEVSQNAFWQLLAQVHTLYTGKNRAFVDRTNRIASPIPRHSTSKQQLSSRVQTQRLYKDIRFGQEDRLSNSKQKQQQTIKRKISVGSDQSQQPQVRQQPIERQPQSRNNTQVSQKKPTLQSQYSKQNTPSAADNNGSYLMASGSYQLLRTKKQQMCTPQRVQSATNSKNSHNSSISRSRMSKTNTPGKPKTQSIPITLQMQLVSLKYLRENGYKLPNKGSSYKDLFEDPLRNGTLLMLVVCRRLNCKASFHLKPTNITHCRQNHNIALKLIMENVAGFPQSFTDHTEQIIKGQRNYFYGIVYFMISGSSSPNAHLDSSLSNRNLMLKTQHDRSISLEDSVDRAPVVQWAQSVLPNRTIRSYFQLRQGIKNGTLLTYLVNELTKKQMRPVHQRPQYAFQCEANITKALTVMAQNRMFNSEFVWKADRIANGDQKTIQGLLQQMRRLYKPKIDSYEKNSIGMGSISFSHVFRSQTNQNENTLNNTFQHHPHYSSKPLETTMANNVYSTNRPLSAKKQQPPIHIDWMRKLGFTCDLSIRSGTVLCRLLQKLTMKTIEGVNYSPSNKGEMLGNIRRALRQLRKGQNGKLFQIFDENQIYNADSVKTIQIYSLVKEAYKNSYAFKSQPKKGAITHNYH